MNGMWLSIATPLSKVHDDRNQILRNWISAIIIVAMAIAISSIALASKAIKPFAGITEAAKRIAAGDLNVKISYESGNEILRHAAQVIAKVFANSPVYRTGDTLTLSVARGPAI